MLAITNSEVKELRIKTGESRPIRTEKKLTKDKLNDGDWPLGMNSEGRHESRPTNLLMAAFSCKEAASRHSHSEMQHCEACLKDEQLSIIPRQSTSFKLVSVSFHNWRGSLLITLTLTSRSQLKCTFKEEALRVLLWFCRLFFCNSRTVSSKFIFSNDFRNTGCYQMQKKFRNYLNIEPRYPIFCTLT